MKSERWKTLIAAKERKKRKKISRKDAKPQRKDNTRSPEILRGEIYADKRLESESIWLSVFSLMRSGESKGVPMQTHVVPAPTKPICVHFTPENFGAAVVVFSLRSLTQLCAALFRDEQEQYDKIEQVEQRE